MIGINIMLTIKNNICNKCQDRKYILQNAKWKPCECLLEHRMISKYQKSRIPPFFYSYTWNDLLKDFPTLIAKVKLCQRLVKKIKQGHRAKFVYVQGQSNSGKQALISLILKEFIHLNMSCRLVNLDELVQMEFDKEQKDELKRIYEVYDVVCLRLGTVLEHKYVRYVLEKFYNTRKNANKYGIFTSRLDMETKQGLYGQEMSRINFIDS